MPWECKESNTSDGPHPAHASNLACLRSLVVDAGARFLLIFINLIVQTCAYSAASHNRVRLMPSVYINSMVWCDNIQDRVVDREGVFLF